jgi:hypothetical protein
MNEISEIYAACLIEYARRQDNGVLKGTFYVFGKDARDAFNLPYSKKIYGECISRLVQIGCLKEYRTWGVETFYKLDSKEFDKAMQEVALGVRKFETSAPFLDVAAAATTVSSSSLFPKSTSIIESYADLGSDYLAEVLESYEQHILQLAEDDEEEAEQSDSPPDPGVADPLKDIEIPASDRLVRPSHNEVAEIEHPAAELLEALERDNGDPDNLGFRERILGEIKAGRELIRSGEFRAYLLYQTLLAALGELISRYKNPTIVALANALLGVVVSNFFQS